LSSDAVFFDRERHFESLSALAGFHLANGDSAAAFPFADRRCRVVGASARDLLLRAEASRLSGYGDFAAEDLAAALEIDPTDEMINSAALRWGPKGGRAGAAERLISNRAAGAGVLALAAEALISEGARAVRYLVLNGGDLEGWIAWEGMGPIELRAWGTRGAQVRRLERDPGHPLSARHVSAANLRWVDGGSVLRKLELVLEGKVVASAETPNFRPPPRLTPPPFEPDAAGAGRSSVINVIVPVYDGLESTRACLGSLIEQRGDFDLRVTVVDDRSPNAGLVAFVERACRRPGWSLIRNESNLGFAAAVNEALIRRVEGDVLLLNSDTLLPAGAVGRLAAAVHSAQNIGTVTPLSNNGELTSYPKPNVATPLGSPERISEMDRLAARANGTDVVDVPNGVGFCLYIKQACLETAGLLPELYARGYYEDVEFCLRARERGFRNVCATGIFVGHAGARSFGAAKRALVVRNLAVLAGRFPDYKLRYAAFVEADPLRPARAAIDRLATPAGALILLASGAGSSTPVARMRAARIAAGEGSPAPLHARTNPRGDHVEFTGFGASGPQSLRFSLAAPAELADLRRYLMAMKVERLEIFDAPALPDALLAELVALETRVEVICADLEWFRGPLTVLEGKCREGELEAPCADCDANFRATSGYSGEDARRRDRLSLALRRADAVRALDRMGEAFARRVFKGKTVVFDEAARFDGTSGRARPGERPVLGVLAPVPSAAVDRLVAGLARLLAASGIDAAIVVLGRCVDDLGLMATGNVFVTGPAAAGEHARLVAQYRIGALASLYRSAFFGEVDRLARASGLPKAYFDWSFGALPVEADDLTLDPRICDEKAASSIAFWLRGLYRRAPD
jgi:GT2 family glycosyltransferase